jgi:hypothetical protein
MANGGDDMRLFVVAVLAFAVAVTSAGSAQQVDPRVQFFLHRDGTLDTVAPAANDDATVQFSILGAHEVHFESAPLPRNWTPAAPADLHLTFTTELSVLGRVGAVLDAAGASWPSTNEDLLVDGRPKDITLTFTDLPASVPAGEAIALTISLTPAIGANGVASLTDVLVVMSYDSVGHPGGLRAEGNDPFGNVTVPPVVPGAVGNDTTGEPLDRTSFPDVLGNGGAPGGPVVLMGVGTSAMTVVAALLLRGRNGLG